MTINKRLIGTVSESKKYVAANVALQWCFLAANIAMMTAVTNLLASLFGGMADRGSIAATAAVAAAAVVIRLVCTAGSNRMGYLSSRAVKKTLREKIYGKLLRLGASYNEQVKTSEVVQVAVEGVDQLETYFGAYLPQFFYAMLAPLTLFVYLCFVSIPSAVVLLVCVPLIPVSIAAVQTWAKKLLSKYWGQYTALCRGGSGESTMLKLFMRFWNAQGGSVKISGRDVADINTSDLRDMESFMTQDTHLFHDSIRNNLRIAKLDATDEEMTAARRKASIHDFIMSRPEGDDTPVGELGDTLSGGERQRLGLARAFLHNVPFLLLDEPTSNLDSLNEAVILKSLCEGREGRTVVLVSHRQSTMRLADTVYAVGEDEAG